MWMSVPQIVVVVIFSTTSSGPAAGMGFSSSTMRPGSTKIAALIFGMTVRSTEWPVAAAALKAARLDVSQLKGIAWSVDGSTFAICYKTAAEGRGAVTANLRDLISPPVDA
jgi:hypothetical protein